MKTNPRRCVVTAFLLGVIPFVRAAVAPPQSVIPTLGDGGVSLRWRAPSLPAGSTLTGFHVYRAPSDGGPWQRLTPSPLPPNLSDYTDSAPVDPAHAFYTLTALVNSGAGTEESPFAAAGQAANNLAYNPSFEIVAADAALTPRGWEMAVWSGTGWAWGTATEAVDGLRSAFLQAGAFEPFDEYGWPVTTNTAMLLTAPERHPVVTPGQAMVSGVYACFRNASGATSASLEPAWLAGIPPTAIEWYPPEYATDAHTSAGQPDAPWRWLANTAEHPVHASADMTRLALVWDVDAATPPGARALFDEVRYQTRRIGPTGTVFGRVQDARGLPVAGARVSSCGRVAPVDPYLGLYVLRDLPTGPVTLTVSVPGQPDRTLTVGNYGGARSPDVTLPQALPLSLAGIVTTADGVPASGARVTVLVPDPDGITVERTATTDGAGRYRIDALPATDRPARVYATKAGYTTASLDGTEGRPLGLAGQSTADLALGAPQTVFEAPRAAVPPAIDGVLSPGEWPAPALQPWFRHPTGAPASLADRGYATWDDANLYLAFEFSEPAIAGVVAGAHGEDAWTETNNIFAVDDTVSVFLDPSRGILWGAGHEAWQIVTNYNATDPAHVDILLRRGPEALYDMAPDVAGLSFRSRVDPAGKLVTELRIPFAGLSAPGGWAGRTPGVGEEWGALFGRYRRQTGESTTTSRTSDWWGMVEAYSVLRFVAAVAPPLRGDLDGDRAVTLADAGAALRITGGLEPLGTRLDRGDVVTDGRVDLRDAARILRAARGLASL